MNTKNQTEGYVGKDTEELLNYQAKGFRENALHLPGPDLVDRMIAASDRMPEVLINFQAFLSHGRLADTAVINKRAGGIGLISVRKTFHRPIEDGIKSLNLVQDVYLDPSITVA